MKKLLKSRHKITTRNENDDLDEELEEELYNRAYKNIIKEVIRVVVGNYTTVPDDDLMNEAVEHVMNTTDEVLQVKLFLINNSFVFNNFNLFLVVK